MISKSSKSDDIDIKIKELMNKEYIKSLNNRDLSSDEYNLLGDLYLKKGDKKSATKYLYKAAKKLSLDQGNKAIATYKKILNIYPSEIDAYEGIITILYKEGLVAEQIKYLLLLAQLYQNKSDFTKMTSIFRKIQEIDPTNKTAELFFSRGKVDKVINNPQ